MLRGISKENFVRLIKIFFLTRFLHYDKSVLTGQLILRVNMETKGELTKYKIIKTARNLFKYQGYKNTTIDDICKASNVKRGNLYFYFKGKEDLAYAAINDAVIKEFPFLDKMMGEQTDPLRKVELMIDGMATHIISEGCKGG